LEVEYGVHLDTKKIGINMETCAGNGGFVDTSWNRDMVKIFTELREVQNNASTSKGGGGAPLQPLAPPIAN